MHYYDLKEAFDMGSYFSIKDYNKLTQSGRDSFMRTYVYESNKIEGIHDDWLQTINEGEKYKKYQTLEGHKNAWENMLINRTTNPNPTNLQIKNLHRILMTSLLPEEDCGHFRKKEVIIGSRTYDNLTGKILGTNVTKRCPQSKNIPYLIQQYQRSINGLDAKDEVTRSDILKSHAYFEWIHPFIDGNGRAGRLILNWLSLAYRQEFCIIESQNRTKYYSFLNSFDKEFNHKHKKVLRS